jgi:hypothetical protein
MTLTRGVVVAVVIGLAVTVGLIVRRARRTERTAREVVSEFAIKRIVNTKERAGRLMRPGSVVVLFLVTVTGAAAVLKEAEVPDAEFWKGHSPAAVVLAVIAALSYLAYCFVVIGFRRILRHSDQNSRLYTTCRDVAELVVKETKLPRECIGVHVWAIRGLPGVRRLERRASFVPVDRTQNRITWRKGKGVLGQCWLRDDWILADLTRMASAKTEREFYAIPKADRFGFNWKEGEATAHYRAILAWPLHGGPENARRVVGVMSVDVQADGSVTKLGRAWTNERAAFDAHLAVCQEILKRGK